MQNKNPKFIYFGTPDVAEKTLGYLIHSGFVPELVVTNPDRPSGRKLLMAESPVKILAKNHNIKVLTPDKIDDEFLQFLTQNYKDIDVALVVAYGHILPQNIIDWPKSGTLNIHYSLLPKYRGASPLQATLLNNDSFTGVTLQKMVHKLDAGPIVAQSKIVVENNMSKDELQEILIVEGVKIFIDNLSKYIEGVITPIPQNENDVTHCGKIKKEDGKINLKDNAQLIYNKYRAYSGWPGIYFFKDGKRIKITKAHLADGQFVIEKVIPEGKKEMDYATFCNS